MFPAHSKNVVQKRCKVKNSSSSIPSFQRKSLLIVSFYPSRKFLSIKKLDHIYIVFVCNLFVLLDDSIMHFIISVQFFSSINFVNLIIPVAF